MQWSHNILGDLEHDDGGKIQHIIFSDIADSENYSFDQRDAVKDAAAGNAESEHGKQDLGKHTNDVLRRPLQNISNYVH